MHFMGEPPRWCCGKESAHQAGDAGSIPGSGRSLGERKGNPLQYLCLENLIDGGAWHATVLGAAKSQTWFSDWAHTRAFYRFLSALLAKAACHNGDVREGSDGDRCLLAASSVLQPLPPHPTHMHCINQLPPPILCRETHVTVIAEASEQGGSRSRKEGVWESMASVFCHFLETWVAQAQTQRRSEATANIPERFSEHLGICYTMTGLRASNEALRGGGMRNDP